MFTGIIEEVGIVRSAEPFSAGRAFVIEASTVLDDLRLGDSVSINGACHTVTAIADDSFSIQSVATTLGRTTLGGFTFGRRVNLERAMTLSQRLGGHLLQGHVDGVGSVTSVVRRGEHVLIDFILPDVVADVTIPLGSIAVDGVSLTVNALPEPGVAQVSIIPHTWEVTALADLEPGHPVNLEGDLIGKYVKHLMNANALRR